MAQEYSYPKNKIKILLLEGVHEVAINQLKNAGYDVHTNPKSLGPDELLEAIQDAHIVGIRSKTKITETHIASAKRLLGIGCFGVGTNQVALDAATQFGVPVFNAPYGNTRSVAELTIAGIILCARRAADKIVKMHQGRWHKSAKGAHEVRGKIIGIVGYGHIGQQVGLLAEAMGMQVVFYDQMSRLPLGNSRPLLSMEELLRTADFITLHVPAKPDGSPLIGRNELAIMKKGSCLLNLSRGNLIDFKALREAVESGKVGGAAIDVYPQEPKGNDEAFDCGLCGVDNIMLTPHIGGSTEEAQYNIGVEVATAFTKFIDGGSTEGAVNFPRVTLPPFPGSHRILNVHRNEPGVMSAVTKIVSDVGANISAQYLSTYKGIGYLIMDIGTDLADETKRRISELPTSIKTRILF